MIWLQVLILVVQVIVAIVGYYSIHRHRAIYSIKTAVLRMPKGTADDIHALKKEHINKILSSGRYTIVQITERADNDLEFIFGQIKKDPKKSLKGAT